MPLKKQTEFSKKVTDLPDVPSPNLTPAQIKTYFQTSADELSTTFNELVDDLSGVDGGKNLGVKDEDGSTLTNVQARLDKTTKNLKDHKEANVLDHPDKSVTESKLAEGSVSRRVIQPGAVGTNELDPNILNQPTSAIGQQAKFQQIDQQFADMIYNVKLYGVKGDGSTDDTAAIQSIINTAISTGGTVYFPKGTYKISSTIVINTSNGGKKLTVQGAGLGVTIISVKTDIDALQVNGYLIKVCDLSISGIAGSTKSGIYTSGTGSCGRVCIEYVQVQSFKNGLFNEASFDQMWIHKCFFSSNSQYGIYFNEVVAGGGALLDITHTITNWNGSHGVHITTTNIYGHVTLRHHEAIGNTGRGISIVGGGSYNMMSVNLENIDIEHVPNTADAALYLENVKKFTIIGGQFTIEPNHTVNASIHLKACNTGVILNPWLRNAGDGFGTPTNYIYVTVSAYQIYLMGANIGGVPIDFTCDASIDKTRLMNLDSISTNSKKIFYPASSLGSAQGAPALSKANDTSVWVLSQAGVDTNPAISLPILNGIKIKKIKIFWFNNGAGTGNIAYQLGYRKTTNGSSLIGTSRTYDNVTTAAAGQNILTITTVTPSDANLMADMLSLWIIRNTSGADTLANSIGIIGVEIDVE